MGIDREAKANAPGAGHRTDRTKPVGLRESKKRETRQLISDHATRLFIEQGFERTTIAEIAAAARVAKKTVTNYFPRKEDLALDHQGSSSRAWRTPWPPGTAASPRCPRCAAPSRPRWPRRIRSAASPGRSSPA